jgi:hypothetical protein
MNIQKLLFIIILILGKNILLGIKMAILYIKAASNDLPNIVLRWIFYEKRKVFL